MDDLRLLLKELMRVRGDWHNLGLQLKVRHETLDRIGTQFPDSKDRLLEMLKTWLTTSDNTSWKVLSDALRSPRVGANRLAGSLERKYCLTKDMRESKH